MRSDGLRCILRVDLNRACSCFGVLDSNIGGVHALFLGRCHFLVPIEFCAELGGSDLGVVILCKMTDHEDGINPTSSEVVASPKCLLVGCFELRNLQRSMSEM